VLAEPDVFDQSDDDGLGLVLISEPPAELLPGVRDAVDRCPAQAVSLEE
jgi:ferredoxin